MAIDLGRVIGPQGERGTKWHVGIGLTGESISSAACIPGTVFDYDAKEDDFYLNTETGEVFRCVVAGDPESSRWTFECCIRGRAFLYSDFTSSQLEGLKGPQGERGPAFHIDEVGPMSKISSGGDYEKGSQDYSALADDYSYLVVSGNNEGYVYVKNQSDASGWIGFPFKGDKGDPGVGIEQVSESSSNEDGGENVITFTFSNNASSSIVIKNGRQGPQGPAMSFDDLSAEQISAITGPPGAYVSAIAYSSSDEDGGVNTANVFLSNGANVASLNIRNGRRGSKWHYGLALVGQGTNIAMQANSFDGEAMAGDMYLNVTTGHVYVCVMAGDISTSRWDYECSIRGEKGDPGVLADAKGNESSLHDYDNASSGFVYFDVDNYAIYVHGAEASSWNGPNSIRGASGEQGRTGPYFRPGVSPDGMLYWENNGGLVNPTPVNLRTAGTNIVLSPMPPSNPYKGLVWIQTSGAEAAVTVRSLNVTVDSERPLMPEDGDIWIKG